MKQSSQDQLWKVTPLLQIVKARQELYLQLLNFITKNINSSYNQHEQLTLFTKFLTNIKLQQKNIISQQKQVASLFMAEAQPSTLPRQNFGVASHFTKNDKQILRLCSRLIQILDASISKTRNSIFNENGMLSLEFTRFKRNLHNTVKGQTVHLGEFTNQIFNYIGTKFRKQIARVQKYIYKLESGATIALKDLFMKQKSDVSSPDQKQTRFRKQSQFKQQKQGDHKDEQGSETDSPNKRPSKRPLLKSTKKRHKLHKSSKKQMQQSANDETRLRKQYIASKLLKFYGMMDLSKKQFLQDSIFQKREQQQHRKKLMNSLLQRNKTISSQISTYYRKSLIYRDRIRQRNNYFQVSSQQKQPQVSSKQKKAEGQLAHSMLKNSSWRKSFVISKRRSSLNFEKNTKILTEHDEGAKNEVFINTLVNIPTRRKSSAQTPKRPANLSKKLFVIKPSVMFQDNNIPQEPVLNTGRGGWFRAPLTSRKSQKKGQNLRLKRRNNPLQMQKSLFNQNFKFTGNLF